MANEQLYDRKASFSFGAPGNVGRLYEGFRIKFKIIKTADSTPNKSNVQIYNLNQDSRALAEKKNLVFILKAGYVGTEENIFSGDVARAITDLDGADYITTFESGDGEKAFREARMDVSFKEGANIKDVFTQLITSLGQTVKDISAIKPETMLNGISLSGLSKKSMDELTSRYGLEWSIQDGGVQVVKKGGATKETAVLLTPSTGLVGIPKKKVDEKDKTSNSIELVSLLQPQIRPGRLIKLESRFISGNFRCDKVTHVGDTHGADWYSQIEATRI